MSKGFGSDLEKVQELLDRLDEEMEAAGGEVDTAGVSLERLERFITSASFVSAFLTQAVGNIFTGSTAATLAAAVTPAEGAAAEGAPR